MSHLERPFPSPADRDPGAGDVFAVLESMAEALARSETAGRGDAVASLAATAASLLSAHLGACVMVFVNGDDGSPQVAASADTDPVRNGLLAQALSSARVSARLGLLGRVLQRGEPVEAPRVSWGQIAQWETPGPAALLDRTGKVAVTIVPVRARWRTVGGLVLARPAPRGVAKHFERVVMQAVADQVGLMSAYVAQGSARASAEGRLRSGATRQAALAELGRWALAGISYGDLVDDAVRMLAERLSVDLVHVFEGVTDSAFLTMTASFGHEESPTELLSTDPTSSPVSYALVTQETVVCEDLAGETRFDVPELWARNQAMSVVEVPIQGPDSPIGVIGVGCRRPHNFADEEVSFVTAVANVLAAAAARSRAESAIRDQALHDPLTGLPNRLVLAEHGHASAVGAQSEMSGARRTVLVLDIDRFKEVNDTLGHALGDLVLMEVARRLHDMGDPVEVVARLGADEFAVVASSVLDPADADALAYQLLAALSAPIDVGGVRLRLRASVGVAEPALDDAGVSLGVPALLRRAEVAMYQAKADHRGVQRYSEDIGRSSLSRLALAGELVEGIDRNEFHLEYQPKVDAHSGRVTGVEALVRWRHPTRGALGPDSFIPLAEQTGMIRELTNFVLAKALSECAAWHRSNHYVPVAVNLSAATVHDPELLGAVTSAVNAAGLSPRSVELEITESAIMFDPEGALKSLEALVEFGLRLSLDDFGTGYSSLSYLQRLPVTAVKIDKSFVEPLLSDAAAQAIVQSVVELAHSLGLSVIAEGVDSAAVMSQLTELGCDALQGYYVASPMPPSQLEAWMEENESKPS